jgi:hypothetical protein
MGTPSSQVTTYRKENPFWFFYPDRNPYICLTKTNTMIKILKISLAAVLGLAALWRFTNGDILLGLLDAALWWLLIKK